MISQIPNLVPAGKVDAQTDSETSADDDCPVSPAPGHRLVWHRDAKGQKYCIEKADIARPEIVTTWVKRADGRIYKEEVTRENNRAKKTTVPKDQTPVYVDHRKSGLVAGHRITSDRQQRDDRQPTFLASDERGGKETAVPSLVKRARLCPVSWTAKLITDQMNPIVWSWAYIADLLAARSGKAPALEAGELEARLQHFLNVMEVTLQTSQKSDYMGDSWKVGRLYHTKVQAKLDQGMTTWGKLVDKWEDATLPHELMAAQQELAPRVTKAKARDGDTKLRDGDGRPPRCASWNIWETKGTCQWESENPGKKCNRLHECTYCKTKKYKPFNHQRLFCQKRIDAGSD
jgi:hypothetical protein